VDQPSYESSLQTTQGNIEFHRIPFRCKSVSDDMITFLGKLADENLHHNGTICATAYIAFKTSITFKRED
jgi:hypothetical protein